MVAVVRKLQQQQLLFLMFIVCVAATTCSAWVPPMAPQQIAFRVSNFATKRFSSEAADSETMESAVTTTSKSKEELDSEISACLSLLNEAATTKQVDSDLVYDRLVQLEQSSRQRCRIDDAYTNALLEHLTGAWQLIFTTGTANTQQKLQRKINYFPIKAVQTFDVSQGRITNAIYVGDQFKLLQFVGYFTFDNRKRRLEFDFTELILLQFVTLNLASGQAAQIGASTGLGSSSNVVNQEKRKKLPFFNWISADANIATARGGGGGLALWKRIPMDE
jgi:hypothetical protein